MTNITLHDAARQALEALELHAEQYPHMQKGYTVDAITALRAALAQPAPHGCHVDLEEGMEPDGCVLDEGSPHKCIYANRLLREGKSKTACEYWKPIEVKR